MTADDLLELSNERDRWQRQVLDAERRGYLAGFADGRAAAHLELDAEWRRAPLPKMVGDGPTHTELELRRWGPGGRVRFADPRPNDFRPAARRSA